MAARTHVYAFPKPCTEKRLTPVLLLVAAQMRRFDWSHLASGRLLSPVLALPLTWTGKKRQRQII